MRTRCVLVCILLLLMAAPVIAADPDPAAPLAPIEWLEGDWHATAAPPQGKPVEIDNHIYWSETRTAIFFVTRFDGKPHYSGMYAWDPAAGQIGFWYVDAEGSFTKGTSRVEGTRLVQEFTIAHADGKTETLRSYLDPNADKSVYHWQVLRPGETKPLIELDYHRQ